MTKSVAVTVSVLLVAACASQAGVSQFEKNLVAVCGAGALENIKFSAQLEAATKDFAKTGDATVEAFAQRQADLRAAFLDADNDASQLPAYQECVKTVYPQAAAREAAAREAEAAEAASESNTDGTN